MPRRCGRRCAPAAMSRSSGTPATVGGAGDPPGFRLDDCATQRNLTDKGRARGAPRSASGFVPRQSPVGKVLSSQWCRCRETVGLDGARHARAGADLQQRLHVPRPRRRIDRRRARDRRGVERARHPGGGDARRQHSAADRRHAGGGRRGGREGRARERRRSCACSAAFRCNPRIDCRYRRGGRHAQPVSIPPAAACWPRAHSPRPDWGLVFDEAFAQQLPATPQCHDGDEPTVRQTEGPVLQAELAAAGRSGRAQQQGAAGRDQRPGSHARLPAGARALVDLWHATSAATTTTRASAIADTCSPMPRAATASAPSCRRSIPAAPATTTSRCRRRSGRC